MAGVCPALVLAGLAALPGGGIVFEDSVATALQAASDGQRLLAVVVTMPYAAGCGALIDDCFEDAGLAVLAERTVNLHYVQGEPGSLSQEWVERVLLANDKRRVLAAPQIIFLDAEQRVLASAVGRMSVGQVEWAWASALSLAGIEVAISERARPPERQFAGSVGSWSVEQAPPTAAQMTELEEQLRRDPMSVAGNYRQLVRSLAPQVLDLVGMVGSHGTHERQISVLQRIAKHSPRQWAAVAIAALRQRHPELRLQAANTLVALAASDAVGPLLKAFDKEKDEAARAAMLLASSASGPADRRVVRTVQRALRSKSEACRVAATRALEWFEVRAPIRDGLGVALADTAPAVRSAAADVIAARRDPSLVPLAKTALEGEADAEVRTRLTAAVAAATAGLALR